MDVEKRKSLVNEASRLDSLLGSFLTLINQHTDAIDYLRKQEQTSYVLQRLNSQRAAINRCMNRCKNLGARRAVLSLLLDISDN